MAKILLKVNPSFTMSNNIDPDDLSHDMHEVDKYKKDELVHDRVSVALFLSMLDVIRDVHDNAYRIHTPVLLMMGENDNIINTEDAIKVFSSLGTVDKKQYICPISNHELFNEVDKNHNLEKLWLWIESKL